MEVHRTCRQVDDPDVTPTYAMCCWADHDRYGNKTWPGARKAANAVGCSSTQEYDFCGHGHGPSPPPGPAPAPAPPHDYNCSWEI